MFTIAEPCHHLYALQLTQVQYLGDAAQHQLLHNHGAAQAAVQQWLGNEVREVNAATLINWAAD